MAPDLSAALRQRVERSVGAYRSRFGLDPTWVGWGPGRVNLIGEHTDYNQGLAMPAAIDRWVVVALGAGPDGQLVVRGEDFDDECTLALGRPAPSHAPSWQRYAAGCVAELAALQPLRTGLQAVVAGDVPLGAGLSSSAAVEMAWLNVLRLASGAQLSGLELAQAAQRVEHRHLGLASGLLDQLASQFSRVHRLMVVDFESLEIRWVPAGLPRWTWVVVESGVRRELAASAYRDRVAECQLGLALARGSDAELRGYRGLGASHLELLERQGHALVAQRLGHVMDENQRVLAMERALASGDAAGAGALLCASHASLRDLYQVSCAELDALVELCIAWPGCAGARMVGGGFGGCVLALVQVDAAQGLPAYLARAYAPRFPHRLRSWQFALVGGAGAVRWEG